MKVPYPTLTGTGAASLRARDWRIAVIGAGGWLGQATLEALHGLLGKAFAHQVVCFGSSDRMLVLRDKVSVAQQALSGLVSLDRRPTLVLHLAFLTQEKAKVMSAEAYVAANREISDQVLSALDSIGAEAVFVASSGAAYLEDGVSGDASKRLYGQLKRRDETRFAEWARTRGKRTVIARVFNVSGPYINKQSSYALACFIADALAGRTIRIAATRRVLRSYVAISELMSVVFGALTDDRDGVVAFDTAGEEVLEMAQIAEVVADAIGCGRPIERGELTDLPPDAYFGDPTNYRRLRTKFGVQPVPFIEQVGETARFMRASQAERS